MFLIVLFSLRKQLILVTLLLFSIVSSAQVFFNNLEEKDIDGNWIGLSSVHSGEAYSGNNYSIATNNSPYGLGIEQKIHNGLYGKNIVLQASGFFRTSTSGINSVYVLTIVDSNNNTILWKGIPLMDSLNNTWNYFSDSLVIPLMYSSATIKAYLWHQDKEGETYLDDLRFEFYELDFNGFIPILPMLNDTEIDPIELYSNNYYTVKLSEKGRILITSLTGDTIVRDITYYSNKEVKGTNYEERSRWTFVKSNQTGYGVELLFKTKVKKSKLRLKFHCNNNDNEIKFIIEEKYLRNQKVYQEALLVNYKQPISEVYRSNRKLDTINFQSEYWLDKQGLKIGNDSNSMILYHSTKISSIQLLTDHQTLYINLDYEKDHPFFRFPLNKDSVDWKVDESSSFYGKAKKISYNFSIYIGSVAKYIPRFMKNNNGFEAAYIWTEHADYTDIRTNRATYFGSEKIIDASNSTGGFVYYDIPITKSVFYDNPDSVSNFDASNGMFNTLESAILTDKEYNDFLDQIYEYGNEICLHTPDHYTTTKERLINALQYMQKKYKSPTWIDHGNNNGPHNNREDLVCDGTLKKSPYFALDLWNKYGIKYLHNSYYEELFTYKDWVFEPSIEKPFSGFGDMFPKPDYFLHPTRTKNLYHWLTTSTLYVTEPYIWEYIFNLKKLNRFIDNWQVEFNHVYPAWVNPKKGMWTFDKDSVIVAQPGLNFALKNLALLRDEGRLNVTTVGDYLDYRTALDNINYQIMNDGRVKIVNNNKANIKGLSMTANASAVRVDGIIPHHKNTNNGMVFWFDINAGESKIIRLEK